MEGLRRQTVTLHRSNRHRGRGKIALEVSAGGERKPIAPAPFELLTELLRRETRIHLPEGFVLFSGWRGHQAPKHLLASFRRAAWEVDNVLTGLDVEHRIETSAQNTGHWWRLEVDADSDVASAGAWLADATEKLDAYDRCHRTLRFWQQLADKVKDLDPGHVAEAVLLAGPPNRDELARSSRIKVKTVLYDYSLLLVRAIVHSVYRVHAESALLGWNYAKHFVHAWVSCLGCAAEAIRIIESPRRAQSEAIPDRMVEEFVEPANMYRACRLSSIALNIEQDLVPRGFWTAHDQLEAYSTVPSANTADKGRDTPAAQLSHIEEAFVNTALYGVLHENLLKRYGGRSASAAWQRDLDAALRVELGEWLVRRPRPLVETPRLLELLLPAMNAAVYRNLSGEDPIGESDAPPGQEKFAMAALTLLDGVVRRQDSENVVRELRQHLARAQIAAVLHGAQPMLAEESRAETTHSLPKGLRRFDKVLRVDGASGEEEAQWFRRAGPTAADIDANRVYVPTHLCAELTKRVLCNPVTLLVGPRSSGKTVLARLVLYELWRGKMPDAFEFDCSVDRDYDWHALFRWIAESEALFLLENMHLNVPALRALCTLIEDADIASRVLVVMRTPSSEGTALEPLSRIPSLALDRFSLADDIIQHFARQSRYKDVLLSKDVPGCLKTAAWRDYRLLAYGLQGCERVAGRGNGRDWVRQGVVYDLRELEMQDPAFPRILVALAPLYRNEVSTAHTYLTEYLGVDRSELLKLVRRCEIIQTDRPGHILYGLPHASLAHAYWEHGRQFLPRYMDVQDYIYSYATSETPNGLEALLSATDDERKALFERLRENGLLQGVLQHEQSFRVLEDFLKCADSIGGLDDACVSVLADRCSSAEGFPKAGGCIFWASLTGSGSAQTTFWERLSPEQIARAIGAGLGAGDAEVLVLLQLIQISNRDVAREVVERIPLKDIVAGTEWVAINRFILHLCFWTDASVKIGGELWSMFSANLIKEVVEAMEPLWGLRSLSRLIESDNAMQIDVARQVKDTVDVQRIVERAWAERDPEEINQLLNVEDTLHAYGGRFAEAVERALVLLAISFDTGNRSSVSMQLAWHARFPRGNGTISRQSSGGSGAKPGFTGVPAWFC